MTTMDPETPDANATGASRANTEAVLAEAAEAVDTAGQRVEMTPLDFPRRLLLVHAHPDDETIGTGVTMAKYVNEGALVTLVTCTLGEEGEVLAPGLEHLAADQEDRLGHHRIEELAAAMRALGVTDHRFLGGPGRWRDSGMMGTPSNERPDCFWQADMEQAVGELVRVVREVRPQVVVTYDENGSYGHPDHIQAHRVAVAAYDAAGDPARYPGAGEPWQVSRVFYTTFPRSFIQSGIDLLKEQGQTMFEGVESADDLPFARPDDEVDAQIDGSAFFEHKMSAMRAHATQISVDGPFFALSNNLGQQALGIEFFTLARGERALGDGPNGWLTDLFAGL